MTQEDFQQRLYNAFLDNVLGFQQDIEEEVKEKGHVVKHGVFYSCLDDFNFLMPKTVKLYEKLYVKGSNDQQSSSQRNFCKSESGNNGEREISFGELDFWENFIPMSDGPLPSFGRFSAQLPLGEDPEHHD